MRLFLLLLVTTIAPFAFAEDPDQSAALCVRLTSIAAAATASDSDLQFAQACSEHSGAERPIAIAALFRHWPEKFHDAFCDFYRIDPKLPARELGAAEINTQVNAVLKQFAGRHALEIATRVYLAFRGTGYVLKRPDGSVLNLETMFRASVLAGISDGSREEVLRLAAIADGKAMPAQR